MIESLVAGVMGTMIFLGIVYAFAKAATNPFQEKLDRLLAVQDDLARRVADLERESAGRV